MYALSTTEFGPDKPYDYFVSPASQLRFSGHKIDKNVFCRLRLLVGMYALSSVGLDWFIKVCFPI